MSAASLWLFMPPRRSFDCARETTCFASSTRPSMRWGSIPGPTLPVRRSSGGRRSHLHPQSHDRRRDMTELQNETLPDDRGITPVGTGDNGRTAMLKRGFGALALTAFAFLIIWGTWKGDKPVSDSARKLMIRQAAAFEPVKETPAAPITTASIPVAPIAPVPAAPVPAPDQLLESARRAPVLAYNRPMSSGHSARDGVTGRVAIDPYGFGRGEPRNDLADKLKPTPIEWER